MLTPIGTVFIMGAIDCVFVVFIFGSVCDLIACWNISNDLFLWKCTTWRNRAFLAAPRWNVGKNQALQYQQTLVEVAWPETASSLYSTNFPHFPFYNKSVIYHDCRRSTTGLETDAKGRLWALEVPDKLHCSARIIVFDLRRNNHVVVSTQLKNVPSKNLRALAVDGNRSTAYIGDPGDESIVIFNLENQRWWMVKMSHGPEIPRVYSSNIAISQKDSRLYVTGPRTLDLFSINLEEWRGQEELSLLFGYEPQNISVFWHGAKMGYSSGLFCDAKGGLHYFMPEQKASVRWDTKYSLRAESHAVLLQDENYPCISDYFADAQRNIWGLVNSKCAFARGNSFKESKLKSRTVKVFKYT